MVANQTCWTIYDLDAFADAGGQNRYEIIDGELFVTRSPHFRHQDLASEIQFALTRWSKKSGLGKCVQTPGIIFTEVDAVVPDLIWISHDRLAYGLDEAGHLILAPELIVEIVSPGQKNSQRDRQLKRKLYSIHGVQEYWVADWQLQTCEIYRRDNTQLALISTLYASDCLTSPLLPEFSLNLSQIFPG
ncbi:MAG: Uma2 family endonuclease [Microcystaceae cyanobacterium]